jgi:hypothetical protein
MLGQNLKIRSNVVIGIVFAMAAGPGWSQVGAPLLGYLPDGKTIRPVYGMAAAAAVSAPLDYGRDFGLIAVSPSQDFAVVTDADSGAVLLAFAGGTATPLTGATASPDRIVLSPRGSAAALWFASTGHLQMVSGLPGSPSIREVDATFLGVFLDNSTQRDAPGALAVSDDGQWLVGAWSRGLYAFGPQGQISRLPIRERAAALAFFAGKQDLAMASDFHVLSVTDVGGAATVATLYAGDRLNPAGMALSSDNRRLVVAETSGSLLTLDLNTGSASRLDCGCTPQGVFAMGRATFRLTGLDPGLNHGAFRLLDTSTGELLYVPLALTSPAGSEGGQQ